LEDTFEQARKAAIDSVFHLLDKIAVGNFMDQYRKQTLGMSDSTFIRAGERSVFPGFQPRTSDRNKPRN